MKKCKVLIILFDALRPDLVTPERMPVLYDFMEKNCCWTRSACVFPSSTRVNAAALGSGNYPGVHGLVVNKLFDANIFANRIMHTGKREDVERAERVYDGRFITCQSLGEVLAKNDLRMAVISSGSVGSTHMVNPRVRANHQVSLCLRDWQSSIPLSLADDLFDRFGPIPEARFPATERMMLQTDLFIDGVYPAYGPDVTVIWYTEPDWSLHKFGLGSSEVNQALSVLDAQFERLQNWADSEAPEGSVQIMVLSDHGCITAKTRVDLPAEFGRAGVSIYPEGGENAPWMASLANLSALWRRDPTQTEVSLGACVEWLKNQPWCGFIFGGGSSEDRKARGVPDLSVVMNRHPRSPELLFTLSSNDAVSQSEFSGSGYFCNPVPVGGAIHGGLHHREMNNLMIMGGSLFDKKRRIHQPAGIVDVAPTVMACLDLEPNSGMAGRVLTEAMPHLAVQSDEPVFERFAVSDVDPRQTIQLARVGNTPYILHAGIDRGLSGEL